MGRIGAAVALRDAAELTTALATGTLPKYEAEMRERGFAAVAESLRTSGGR